MFRRKPRVQTPAIISEIDREYVRRNTRMNELHDEAMALHQEWPRKAALALLDYGERVEIERHHTLNAMFSLAVEVVTSQHYFSDASVLLHMSDRDTPVNIAEVGSSGYTTYRMVDESKSSHIGVPSDDGLSYWEPGVGIRPMTVRENTFARHMLQSALVAAELPGAAPSNMYTSPEQLAEVAAMARVEVRGA